MKYTVRKSIVDVVGKIWMPYGVICSLRIEMRKYDVDNARETSGKLTRDSLERWLLSHTGDFSEVIDFRASIEDGDETIDFGFATEDGEFQYLETIGECEEV